MNTAEVVRGILICAAIAGTVRSQGLDGKPQILTLQDAQSRAAAAGKMAELANLGVKAARFHRLGVQADYFPHISSQFSNLHFNKFMGQRLAVANRSVGLPLLDKDQTVVIVSAVQPVTPIFQIRQAVRLARADERIAQAKADAAAAALKANVQSAYFALLIAQRQQAAAQARAKLAASPVRLASTAPATGNVEPALAAARHRVQETTEALRVLLRGSPEETYELLPPPPADDADFNGPVPALAVERNPDVVEAREGVEKAKAAVHLAKLNYMPEVVGVFGYSFQNAFPLLPNDFSFVGFMASWNIFDFGKRERLVSERSTQLRMAQINLELVRAKVAAGSAKAASDVQRTRRVLQLTRQLVTMTRFDTGPDASATRAQAEAEMYQADLEFRQALQQKP